MFYSWGLFPFIMMISARWCVPYYHKYNMVVHTIFGSLITIMGLVSVYTMIQAGGGISFKTIHNVVGYFVIILMLVLTVTGIVSNYNR